MKYLLALVGFFLCLNASAGEIRPLAVVPLQMKVACTDQVDDALYNVTVAKEHTLVFKRRDGGGGELKLYENLKTGEWVMLRFVGKSIVCFIASGKPEVGS